MRWPWISRQAHDHEVLDWRNRANEYRLRSEALELEAADMRHRLLNRLLDAAAEAKAVVADPAVMPVNPTVSRLVDRAIRDRAPAHAKLYRRRLAAWAAEQARDGVAPEAVAAMIVEGEADLALNVDLEDI